MPPSRRSSDLGDERGSASLEFLTAGFILLLPIVYLILAVSSIQAGSLAVEGAARQAARVFVQADDTSEAADRAEQAIRFALSDYGIDARSATVSVACRPDPDNCLARRGFVTVTVETRVPLPLVPAVLRIDQPLGITLSSSATQQVSRFWGAQ